MAAPRELINGHVRCSACRLFKPLETFSPAPRRAHGVSSRCRACNNGRQADMPGPRDDLAGLSEAEATLPSLGALPAWQSQAACAPADPRLFDWDNPDGWTEAARICATCPVIVECANWASTDWQLSGFLGGAPRRVSKSGLDHWREEQRRERTPAPAVRKPMTRAEADAAMRKQHPEPGMKVCGHCGKSKPHPEFSTDRARWDGLRAWCRGCDRERQRQRRQARRDVA